MAHRGLDVRAAGIAWRGAKPQVAILAGPAEEKVVLRPDGDGAATRHRSLTMWGPAETTTWSWRDARGYTLTWTLNRFLSEPGFTLRVGFHNASAAPVRLSEMALVRSDAAALRCTGEPADWLLSTLDIALRIGNLAETLAPIADLKWSSYGAPFRTFVPPDRAADGHWRIYKDWITLYSARTRQGVVLGATGEPTADLRFDCQVEAGRMRLDIVSQMSDVTVDPGRTRESQELLFLAGPYEPSVLAMLRGVAAGHGARTHRPPATGWCSWYDMLDKITGAHVEDVVRAAAELRERLPMDVIQVDMGYERGWGDWAPNEKFTDGWSRIVPAIRQASATPGIWLAPLGVTGTGLARLAAHTDWFQHRKDGSLIGDPGKEQYLDPTHPDARRFLREILREARAAGFEYFKIDYNEIDDQCRFHDPRLTRFEAYRQLYRLYREEIGEGSYLLACAGFARATVGFADASRVGWDARAKWDFKPGEGPICILEAIHCVGQSALANGILFANDPDVTYLRPRDTLTTNELRVWQGFVGLLGGAVLISEPLDQPDYAAAVRLAEIVTPPTPERGRSFRGDVDRHHQQFGFVAHRAWGDFACVQLWNAAPEARSLELDPGALSALGRRFHAWSFWDEAYLGVAGPGFRSPRLNPRSAVIVRLTPVADDPGRPVLVGSTLHMGMGAAEIAGWAADTNHVAMELTDAGAREGRLILSCARELRLDAAQGCAVPEVRQVGAGLWSVEIRQRARRMRQSIGLAVGTAR
jgi:hypothetical protein